MQDSDRKVVANVEKAGWSIDKVQDLAAKGIFKKIDATKPA